MFNNYPLPLRGFSGMDNETELRIPTSLRQNQLAERLTTRPPLFKRWIALPTGQITIQRISIRETNSAIHWIDFYPVGSANQRLNNRGQATENKSSHKLVMVGPEHGPTALTARPAVSYLKKKEDILEESTRNLSGEEREKGWCALICPISLASRLPSRELNKRVPKVMKDVF